VRLFVAIDPPPDAIEHLRAKLDLATPLRWTDPAQWHLTLTFCGEVDQRTADDLSVRLARAASRAAPMQLRLSGAGAFSGPARAHVLWAGLAGDVDALGKLAASTSAAARRARITVEDRRFRAHLTIARTSPPRDLRELVQQLSSYDGPTWTASELHLVRSHLGPPTVHERTATFALAGHHA
jgi:2'-5' RNA ligase